jgi:hypothetical protein
MSKITIELNDKAPQKALLYYAKTVLSLPVKANTGVPKLLSKIKEVSPDLKSIEVPADVVAEEGSEAPAAAASSEQETSAPQTQTAPSGDEQTSAPAPALAPAPTPTETKATSNAKPKGYWDEKIKVLVHRGEGAQGKKPIEVGVNGKVMLIPRGEECDIPRKYFEVIKNAVQEIITQDTETGDRETHKAPLYPYSVISE